MLGASGNFILQIIRSGQTFFYVELDNGDKMIYKIDQKGFPLQFGRYRMWFFELSFQEASMTG